MSTLLRPPVLAVDFSSAQTIEYTTSNSSTSPNVLSSTGGTALSVVNTTIGANGMNFKSISANGGNHGIVLTSTSGNLTVTGDGTGQANGSGGTIQNITGGVLGNNPVWLTTVSGTITLKSMNMSITVNAYSGMHVDNNLGGTATVNVIGCTFTGVQAGNSTQQKALLQFEAGNTGGNAANLTANVQDSFFFDNRTYGMFATAAGDSIMNVTLNQSGFGTNVNTGAPVNNPGTTITNPPPFSLGITNGSNAKVDYTVTNNTFWGADASKGAIHAVAISGSTNTATSHLSGTLSGNKIGKTGVPNSGCNGNCGGIGLLPGTAGTFNATVTNNDIRQTGSVGINFFNSVTAASGTSIGHITNNTLAEPQTGFTIFLRAIVVSSGNSGGSTANWCADVKNNTISGPWQAGNWIRVTTNNTTGTLTLPGLTPTSGATAAQVNAFLEGQNTFTGGTGSDVNTTVSGAINGGSPCPLMLMEGGVMAVLQGPSLLSSFFDVPNIAPIASGAEIRRLTPEINTSLTVSLTQNQLDSIVSAAIDRWSSTGLTAKQIETLRAIKFDVADLSGAYLGEASDNHILIDRTADGKGWFVDPTPQNDSEFGTKTSVTLRYTDPMNAAAGRVDLLTAIEHEMGHKLGLNDTYLEKDRDSLMYGYLTVGERRLPSRDQAKGTRPNVSSTHFLSLEPESGEILIAPALSNDSQLRSSTMNIALLRSSVDGFAEAFRKHFDPAELRAGIRGQRSEIRDRNSDVRLNHGRRKADGGKQKAVGRKQKSTRGLERAVQFLKHRCRATARSSLSTRFSTTLPSGKTPHRIRLFRRINIPFELKSL